MAAEDVTHRTSNGSGHGGKVGCHTASQAADRRDGFCSLSLSSPKPKSALREAAQVVDHLVPEPGFWLFEFFRERESGKLFVFKGLQKPLSAQIQEN